MVPDRVVWDYSGNSRVFHAYVDCQAFDAGGGMKFGTVQEAREAGLCPCETCYARWKEERARKQKAEKERALRGVRLVYWREDVPGPIFHTERDCPGLLPAACIGQGTIEQANAKRKVVLCRECVQLQQKKREREAERREIAQKDQEAREQKIKEGARKEKWNAVFLWVFFTLIACVYFFSAYADERKQQSYKEGYDAGNEEGENSGYDDGYDAGYENGHLDGEDSGYGYGYDDGYNDGYNDGLVDGSAQYETYNYSAYNVQENQQIVYVTATGSKYHAWGCQYLAEFCYSISLSDAIAQGYTACSRCW